MYAQYGTVLSQGSPLLLGDTDDSVFFDSEAGHELENSSACASACSGLYSLLPSWNVNSIVKGPYSQFTVSPQLATTRWSSQGFYTAEMKRSWSGFRCWKTCFRHPSKVPEYG